MYHDNPFHNFEHASHVTMSITKLMSRIVAPTVSFDETSQNHDASAMHDHTYGITSDPLTQLAVIISGIIHGTFFLSILGFGKIGLLGYQLAHNKPVLSPPPLHM